MNSYGFDTINEQTGFAQGERFGAWLDVRDYFTVANIQRMFGRDAEADQDVLDAMANEVATNGWHCNF